jgi:Fur family zinc uptake transcriptional regulator
MLYYNTLIMTKMNIFLNNAYAYCDENHHRLTDPRRYVLKILSQSKTPMGAYDILEKLGHYLDSPKPPTAYRAIDFWRDHGFLHKIESLNAYVTCCEDHKHQDTHFLVCNDCHAVEELHVHSNETHLPDGFVATKTFTETHGTCGECAK